MLGNDDPASLRTLLDDAPWGTHAEGKVVMLDDRHEMISWGYSNITPWHSHREQTEAQLAATLRELAGGLKDPEHAIVNVHVPPFGTQLDDAPVLDDDLRVVQSMGRSNSRRWAAPRSATSSSRRSRCSGCTATSTNRPASAGWAERSPSIPAATTRPAPCRAHWSR